MTETEMEFPQLLDTDPPALAIAGVGYALAQRLERLCRAVERLGDLVEAGPPR